MYFYIVLFIECYIQWIIRLVVYVGYLGEHVSWKFDCFDLIYMGFWNRVEMKKGDHHFFAMLRIRHCKYTVGKGRIG